MEAWMVTKKRTVKWFSLRSRGNPQKICESSESDCEDSEVLEPTVTRNPQKG